MKFTTKDNDNDACNWSSSGDCAFTSAQWYYNCYYSSLNDHYGDDPTKSILWCTWRGCLYFQPYVNKNTSYLKHFTNNTLILI